MNRIFLRFVLFFSLLWIPVAAFAAADLEIDTPAIAALKNNMQQRHGQLAAYYASGAIGLTRDGLIAMRDANLVPLPARQAAQGLIAAENQDRQALYREIARANGHPEWEGEIRSTFAQRWVERAQRGWWYQGAGGSWAQK